MVRGHARWSVKGWSWATYADLRADARAARLVGDSETRRRAQELIRADAAARWAKLGIALYRGAIAGLLLALLAGVLAIVNASGLHLAEGAFGPISLVAGAFDGEFGGSAGALVPIGDVVSGGQGKCNLGGIERLQEPAGDRVVHGGRGDGSAAGMVSPSARREHS